MSTVIIYGPQGCGKTRNAQLIAKTFGITAILDGWHGKGSVPEDTLVLTNVQGIEGARDYYQVMVEVYEKSSPARQLAHKTFWAIEKKQNGKIHFAFYKDGNINESYADVPIEYAAVYAAAIVNGFEPPKEFKKRDDSNSEPILKKGRARLPYTSQMVDCLYNAVNGQILDYILPEEGDK